MPSSFGVVDLFAGPGGLGEGFASLTENGHAPYRISMSVENEPSAHRTLTLRAFLREHRRREGSLPNAFIEFHAGRIDQPAWADVDAEMWQTATNEVRNLELGTDSAAIEIDHAIERLRPQFDDTILIGGPPCQAYSLAGRARTRGNRDYVPEEDERHYLFREYIRVLEELRPAAFVMENVKGILSSTVESRLVFEMLMEDLSSLGTGSSLFYELYAIKVTDGYCSLHRARHPSDFVVRAEDFGVPQRRHRVFVIGLRADVAPGASGHSIPVSGSRRLLEDAIGDLPRLRSGLSRGIDSASRWKLVLLDAAKRLAEFYAQKGKDQFHNEFMRVACYMQEGTKLKRSATALPSEYGSSRDDLKCWLENRELKAIAQHETRGHMESDLSRYMFAAVYGRIKGKSPKAGHFPQDLSPCHRNWHTGVFADRFRVQVADRPGTTVTSHISKDGHYYIHHDPLQCRSLTVREAARLQTFPDDYLFVGNRTSQYVQVGNAVPPYLARSIALLLLRVLDGKPSPVTADGDVRPLRLL